MPTATAKSRPRKVTGYRFLEQDPIVDLCRTVIDMSGFRLRQIHDEANHSIAESTIRNLAYGTTRRPTHNTVRTVIEACGGKEVFILPDGHRLAANYEATSRKDLVRMANGHGWRAVEPIHPHQIKSHLRQRQIDYRKTRALPPPAKAPRD